jgi:hypothetical protein
MAVFLDSATDSVYLFLGSGSSLGNTFLLFENGDLEDCNFFRETFSKRVRL